MLNVGQRVAPIGSVESKGSVNDRSDRGYCFKRRKSEYFSDEALFPASKIAPRPPLPAKEMLLRVESKNFVAGAVFKRRNGIWKCVEAAPIIEWMTRVRSMELIKSWLLKQGCEYSFTEQ